MTELKPCWCGGHPVTVHEAMMFDGYGFAVRCVRCGCQTKFKPTEEQAAEEWNRAFASNEALHTQAQAQRTCRNISPKLGNNEFTCEECLARVYGSGGRWFDVNWDCHKFNYCPACGRKVEA